MGRGLPSLSTRATDLLVEVLGSPFTLPDVSKLTAIVYIDGFNLYRRALENTPYRWLDIDALVSMLLADYEVIQIRYFTAIIKSLPNDLAQAQRQQTYLRALGSNPKIVIHKGQFRSDIKLMPVVPWEFDENGNPVTVKVRKRKEKGSDVNLARIFYWTHL